MKFTQEESDIYIVEHKGCRGLICEKCFYDCSGYMCNLEIKIQKYKCGDKDCEYCDWFDKDKFLIYSCKYFFLEDMKKLELIQKILK